MVVDSFTSDTFSLSVCPSSSLLLLLRRVQYKNIKTNAKKVRSNFITQYKCFWHLLSHFFVLDPTLRTGDDLNFAA